MIVTWTPAIHSYPLASSCLIDPYLKQYCLKSIFFVNFFFAFSVKQCLRKWLKMLKGVLTHSHELQSFIFLSYSFEVKNNLKT